MSLSFENYIVIQIMENFFPSSLTSENSLRLMEGVVLRACVSFNYYISDNEIKGNSFSAASACIFHSAQLKASEINSFLI